MKPVFLKMTTDDIAEVARATTADETLISSVPISQLYTVMTGATGVKVLPDTMKKIKAWAGIRFFLVTPPAPPPLPSLSEKYGCEARKKRGRRGQKEKRKHICCWHIEEYALCTEDIIEDSDLHKHALLGHHIPPFSPFSSPFSSPFNGMSFPSWPSSSWLCMLPVLHCCVFCFYQNWLPELHRQ